MSLVTKILISGFILLASGQTEMHRSNHHCQGFMPENDLWIGVDDKNAGGVSEQQFNDVLNKLESIYSPIIQAKGGTLVMSKNWTDGTVNASASRWWNSWYVNMFGGMARHRLMTSDSFAVVACHELGHHLGGIPKISGWMNSWASVEGEADYFATLKCLRKLFADEDNESVVNNMEVKPLVKESCEHQHTDRALQLICIRSAMASEPLAQLLAELRGDGVPDFSTPDGSKASRTVQSHPPAQCRLDTYFNASVCTADSNQDLSDSELYVGACKSDVQPSGARPLCWFAP